MASQHFKAKVILPPPLKDTYHYNGAEWLGGNFLVKHYLETIRLVWKFGGEVECVVLPDCEYESVRDAILSAGPISNEGSYDIYHQQILLLGIPIYLEDCWP